MSGFEQAELLSLWLIAALLVAFFLWRRNASLAKLFLLSASARVVVAVLQSGYGLFGANQDSVVYADRGSLLASDTTASYVLGDVSPNQLGIIAMNAWVSTFTGPIPTTVMVAVLASLISALAVVLVVTPFLTQENGTPHYSRPRSLVFYGAALSPSFLFWGSLDLKEPFLMLGVAMFVYAFYVGWPTKAIFGPGGIIICIAFRPYIGVLVGCVGLFFALARSSRRRAPRATLAVLLLAALFVGIRYGPNIVGVDLSEQAQYSQLAGGNSVIALRGNGWLANVGDFFFAPLPWQTPTSIQGVLSYIESMLIGGLIIRYLFHIVSRRRKLTNDAAVIATLLYCTSTIIYAAAIANSGTLSRERSPFLLALLPFLIFPMDGLDRHSSGRGTPRRAIDALHPTPRVPSIPATT